MARPGIMIFFELREETKYLTDEEMGKLIRAALFYGEFGEEPEFDGILAGAWGFVKSKIDRDGENYDVAIGRKTYISTYCKKVPKGQRKPFKQWYEEDYLQMSTDISGCPTTTTTPTSSAAATTTAAATDDINNNNTDSEAEEASGPPPHWFDIGYW